MRIADAFGSLPRLNCFLKILFELFILVDRLNFVVEAFNLTSAVDHNLITLDQITLLGRVARQDLLADFPLALPLKD